MLKWSVLTVMVTLPVALWVQSAIGGEVSSQSQSNVDMLLSRVCSVVTHASAQVFIRCSPAFEITYLVDLNGAPQPESRDRAALKVDSLTKPSLPGEFSLAQNYPNPFNPSTTIELSLPVDAAWSITIFNSLGQDVEHFEGTSGPGLLALQWDASKFASGVYFYRAQAGSFVQARKMLLLK